MKRFTVFLLLYFWMSAGLCFSEQIRIAVYVSGVLSENYRTLLGDNLVETFAESNQYIAVNRSAALNSMLKEAQSIQENGHIDYTQVVSATKQYGESQLCAVNVIEIDYMYVFRASLLDVLTNTVIKTASAESSKNEIGYTKIIEIAHKLSYRLLPNEKQSDNTMFNSLKAASDIDLARRRVEENKMYDISYAEFKENGEYFSNQNPESRHYMKVKSDLNLGGTLTMILVGGGGAAIFAGIYGDKLAKENYNTMDEKNSMITAMVCGMVASFIPGIVLLSTASAYKKKAWKAYRKPYDDAVKDLNDARKYQRSSSLQFYPTGGSDWAGIGMKVTFN